MTGPPAIEFRDIAKHFGGVRALQGVTFQVQAGEIVALVGDNGAGKSTLVKIASGVLRMSSGELRVGGDPASVHSPKDASSLGVETVYQDLALVDPLGVSENFFLGRELSRGRGPRFMRLLSKSEMASTAEDALDRLGVSIPDMHGPIGLRSGGQRQIVAMARAAYWQGRILLLDEPTAALGVRESAEVLELIKMMASQGQAVLLISHDMQHVWTVADRVVVLRHGRIAVELDPTSDSAEDAVAYLTGARV